METNQKSQIVGRPNFSGQDPRFIKDGFTTKCVHAGESWEATGVSTPVSPISLSNVFSYQSFQEIEDLVHDRREGFAYYRWGSPTASTLQRALSTLEQASSTVVTSSGMAAIHLALLVATIDSQKPVLCSNALYGSTLHLFKSIFCALGKEMVFCDFTDLGSVEKALEVHKPGAVYLEVLSNPMLKVMDAPEIIQMAHAYGARVLVDNTFLTPYLYRPFDDGADFVCHSLSKYLSGHGDVMAGAVSCREVDSEALRSTCANLGCVAAANSVWLALRGIKTLELRMERHCRNALELATYLENHPGVERVFYPGLASHPQHEIASRLFSNGGYGGMVAFRLKNGSKKKAYRFIDSLRLFTAAGSLGEIHSLILYPASTTHHSLTPEELQAAGIDEATLRISVGIENIEDLKGDLDQAFAVL